MKWHEILVSHTAVVSNLFVNIKEIMKRHKG